MSIKHVVPYIHLNGSAAHAIALYQQALGATVMGEIMRYGQIPNAQVPADQSNLVMHCVLKLGDEMLMVSDSTPDRRVPETTNLSILLELTDPAELQPKFDALAKGGTVEMALHDTFWGARFGVVVDAFGVRWNFHHAKKSA